MNFLRYIFDPAVIIIVAAFVSILVYAYKNFTLVNKNLLWFISFLEKFK